MFVERDTGPRNYFGLPLQKVYEIFSKAFSKVIYLKNNNKNNDNQFLQVSGLARTVRGPSMSATPGKIHVLGISEIKGEKVFVLKFL